METKKLYLNDDAYEVAIVRRLGACYLLSLTRCSDKTTTYYYAKIIATYSKKSLTIVVFILAGKTYCATLKQERLVEIALYSGTHVVHIREAADDLAGPVTVEQNVKDKDIEKASCAIPVGRESYRGDFQEVLVSPLAGRVISLLVEIGQRVTKNEPLIVIESMKMENELCSPSDAIIKTLFIQPGDLVQPKQVLIRFGQVEGEGDATSQSKHE